MLPRRPLPIAAVLMIVLCSAAVPANELSTEPPNHPLALSAAAMESKKLHTTEAVDAREPLTFRDVGLYGWWQPYFWEGPFDFVIAQAFVHPHDSLMYVQNANGHPEVWNKCLMRARAAGKRVIAIMTPAQGKAFDEADFKAMVQFLENVHRDELYAVSLSEENIFWNGQHEQLAGFYHRLKEQFPDVPIFQWYSNTGRATARPGFVWPWLPADGWLIDEYWAMPDDLEEQLVRYRALGLPVINTVFASTCHSQRAGEPGRVNFFEFHANTFSGQLRIAKKYNLPCAFYCVDNLARDMRTWAWHEKARADSRAVFDLILKEFPKIKATPDDELRRWDDAGEFRATVLESDEKDGLGYRESFDLRMKATGENLPAHDFMTRSLIRGLPHMQWQPDPSRIVIRARGGEEDVDVSVTMHWVSPEAVDGRFGASAKVIIPPDSSAEAILEVSANGYDWVEQTTEIVDGVLEVLLPRGQSQLYTRLRVSGNAQTAGQPLAEIDWIEVRGMPVGE